MFTSSMIHFGGDEVILYCWKNNKEIDEYMQKNNIKTTTELFNKFISNSYQTVWKVTDKDLIYWLDEFSFEFDYPNNQILQYWGDAAKVKDFANRYPQNWHILSMEE